MKRKAFCLLTAFALCAGAAVSGFAVPALAAETRTVRFEDGRSITVTFADLIAEEIIMVRGDNGVAEEMCYYIPFSGTEVTFSGDLEGEGCRNENLIFKNGAYEPNGSDWRNWDIFADGSRGLIFDFDREYGGDYDYYERSDFVDYYHGFYFKYSHDFRPAWHGKITPWAIAEIGDAIDKGLVPESLLEKDNYKGSITRGEAAQVIIRLIEKTVSQSVDEFLKVAGVSINNNAFTDTGDRSVLAANALGIINGVGNNRFDPGGILTRAQFAAVINRVARVMGVSTAGFSHTFTDVKGHWVDIELGWPVHADIIGGVGNNKFDPEGTLTIEQTIAMTDRCFNALKRITLNPGLPPSGASAAMPEGKYCVTTWEADGVDFLEFFEMMSEMADGGDKFNRDEIYIEFFSGGKVAFSIQDESEEQTEGTFAVAGNNITLFVDGAEFKGTVDGNTITIEQEENGSLIKMVFEKK